MSDPSLYLQPDWPAPASVHAAVTTRRGGVSRGPYDSLNLATHVGDRPSDVAQNRRLLMEILDLPQTPRWLNQVHGNEVVEAARVSASVCADAAIASRPGQMCGILTADCLPVLFCDRQGTRVAAAHAGWRGLAAGVLESTLDALQVAAEETLAWLGPAIGPGAFEVGAEVRQVFVDADESAAACFVPSDSKDRFLADLYALARLRLQARGVNAIYGGGLCTYTDAERFYSYRRDGACGRMAALVWLV